MDAHNNLYMEKADSAKLKENEDGEKIINFLRKKWLLARTWIHMWLGLMLFLVVLNVFRACKGVSL